MTLDLRAEQPWDDPPEALRMRAASRDHATGLPTVAASLERVRAAVEERGRVGVIQVDAVNIELVESLYGWQVFDRIVARIAGVLRSCLGQLLPPRTLLAIDRIAGDRFIAFVLESPGGGPVDGAALGLLGRALRHRLEPAFAGEEFAGINPPLAFRSGRSLITADPFVRFERRAYAALDEAAGFSERRQRRRELSWGEELEGILRDRRLETAFQPIVRLTDGAVVGFEGWVRGPRQSLFEAPGVMFAMAQRLGSEIELDRVCLGQVLGAAARADVHLPLFVNVLPRTLGERSRELLETLSVWGGDPRGVIVELGERRLGDSVGLVGAARSLRERGFRVAVDNVGTGSPGADLGREIRPDFVKLDASLVRDVHNHLIKQSILSQLMDEARSTGAEAIGVGVENAAEAAVLASAGVHYAQGFHFAAPAAPSASLLGGSGAAHGTNPRG